MSVTVETDSSTSDLAGPARRLGLFALAGMVVASLAAWWLLHRYWFMAGDDYLHIGIGGHQGGRFTAGDWWRALGEDWRVSNGRISDAVLRLTLRPGEWFYRLFAPLLITGMGLAIGWTAMRGRRSRPALWVWAAGLLTLPTLLWLSPWMAGDAVFWAAGALNYVMPLALLVLCIGVFAHLLSGGDVPWALMPLLVVLVMLTDAMQEMSSLALFLVVVAVIGTQRRSMGPKLWVLCGAAVLAFAVHMSAPGLWKRADLVWGTTTGGPVERLVNAIASSSAILWERTQLLWLVLIGLLALLALRRGLGRADRAVAWIAVVSVVGFVLAAGAYRSRFLLASSGTGGGPEGLTGHAALVVAMLAFAGVSVALVLLRAQQEVGVVPLLAWVALFGNAGFVFGGGVAGYRAHMPPAALLMLVLLALVARPAARDLRWDRIVAVAVAAAMLMPSLGWFDHARVRLVQNQRFVETQVIPLLEDAARETSGRVVIPLVPPYPELTYGAAFLLPRYNRSLHDYFGIDPRVKLVNPR